MELLDVLNGLPNPLPTDGTESDTRAAIIDPILSALGWASSEIKREPYAGWPDSRGFVDYLLLVDGNPMMVLEAKKTGRTFSLPRALTSQRVSTYRKIRSTASENLLEALDQCLRYAQHTGALYACATNGADWIFFKPTHHYRSLPDAKVVIFNGTDQIAKRLDVFLDLISPEGLQQGRAEKELLGHDIQVPTFSKRLEDTFPYRGDLSIEEETYSNILDQMLRHYVVELTDDVDFEECYLPAKGNRTTANSLREMIAGRVDALRNGTQKSSEEFSSDLVSNSMLSTSPSGRTVLLHGEIGVGKTSFLRHCEQSLRSSGTLDEAVWARVDLLPFQDRHFEPEEVKTMLDLICKRIQDQVSSSTERMSGKYDPDTWAHLRDIYNTEVRKFQKARYPDSDNNDPVFVDEARKYVWSISKQDPQDHLVRVLRWLTVNCKLPVVLALDNSDQLGLAFQEFLHKLTETLKAATSAVVILVLRTEALASHSIREHSIASVRDQFLVHKAPLAQVLQRRFSQILKKMPEAYPGTENKVARDRISVLMDTLQNEADLGSESFQVVEASGNGSLRDSLRAVSAIFRTSPKAMDRLVVEQFEKGKARLSVTQAIRALMKEDMAASDAAKLVPNIFNVDGQLTMPYSLGIRQLQQVQAMSARKQYTVGGLLNDFSVAGVDRLIAARTLNRLRADGLISVTHMFSDLSEGDVLRTTRLGEVLLEVILSEFSYFCRMAFNTFIYDKTTYLNMRSAWTSGIEEYRKKFFAIGSLFIEMIAQDDANFRRRIDLSLLEPLVGAPLPGLLVQT